MADFPLVDSPKSISRKFWAFECVKMADFAFLELPKLISRKIWVTEKLWNFHIVRKFMYLSFYGHKMKITGNTDILYVFLWSGT